MGDNLPLPVMMLTGGVAGCVAEVKSIHFIIPSMHEKIGYHTISLH